MRKYSMNVEFNNHQNDLIGSPIKECIKEQISEDEDEDVREDLLEIPFIKHKTCGPKPMDWFDDNPLFELHNKGNDLNLDTFDKHGVHDFPMDVDDGLAPCNSLNIMNDNMHKVQNDRVMEDVDDLPFNMDVEIEDSYYPITQNFDNNAWNLLN